MISSLISTSLRGGCRANQLIVTSIFNKSGYISLRHATTSSERTTCLIGFHKRRQARLEPFAGYLMPIVYRDQTIRSEHCHTRTSASAFDVSHMLQTIVRGKDRCKFIENLTVADVESLGVNTCALSMITNENGGIIDDCIIGKRSDYLHIVSNAGNAEIVWSWLNKNLDKGLDVELERQVGRGLIALQGPKAAQILQSKVDLDLSQVAFMATTDAKVDQIGSCQLTRCGYTGEDGFEISVEPDRAEDLMELLCQHVDLKPAGLGARDTLRLEAGLCLHGHDIDDKTTPIEASLDWTVHKRRRLEAGFPGSQVILGQLKQGSKIKRVGITALGPGPPAREGCKVLNTDKMELGTVTSGTFSPSLGKNIAMAYIPTKLSKKIGQTLICNVRGKGYEYQVTKMPFVEAKYYFKRDKF